MIKYVKIWILILAGCCIPVQNAFSQSVSKDGYINYTVGNKWKYESRYSDKELTIEIKECTETDTLTTCQVENFGELIVQKDSVFITDFFDNLWPDRNIGVIKFYMVYHPLDSLWDACLSDCGFGVMGGISDTTRFEVFSENVLVKDVGFIQFLSENDSLGNPVMGFEISEKFGFLSIQPYEGEALILTGAVIEEKSYGSLIVSNEDEEKFDRVQNFSLSEPYPNPFNPSVSVELRVTRPEEIKIQVFDVLGRLILALPSKVYAAGIHQVHLEVEKLPTGVFYIVAQSSSQSSTKKITKIK